MWWVINILFLLFVVFLGCRTRIRIRFRRISRRRRVFSCIWWCCCWVVWLNFLGMFLNYCGMSWWFGFWFWEGVDCVVFCFASFFFALWWRWRRAIRRVVRVVVCVLLLLWMIVLWDYLCICLSKMVWLDVWMFLFLSFCLRIFLRFFFCSASAVWFWLFLILFEFFLVMLKNFLILCF